jgi:hypothetical protein
MFLPASAVSRGWVKVLICVQTAVRGSVSACDHVLDVVRVSRTIDVGVVPRFGFVLDVRRNYSNRLVLIASDTALGDLLVRPISRKPFMRLHAQDRRGERSLSVVDVTDSSNVNMHLLNHCSISPFITGWTSSSLPATKVSSLRGLFVPEQRQISTYDET